MRPTALGSEFQKGKMCDRRSGIVTISRLAMKPLNSLNVRIRILRALRGTIKKLSDQIGPIIGRVAADLAALARSIRAFP
jgi:hypothetical protein